MAKKGTLEAAMNREKEKTRDAGVSSSVRTPPFWLRRLDRVKANRKWGHSGFRNPPQSHAFIWNGKWGHSGFRNPPQCYAVYLQYAITQMERVMIKVLTIKDLESQHSGK